MKRALLSALLFLAPLGPGASAADFSGIDMTPYLTVNTRSASIEPDRPRALTRRETQRFITQGGAYFFTSAIRTGSERPESAIFNGLATPAQLSELRNRLNAHGIRGMRSCEQVVSPVTSLVHEITWTSIHGRRNAFTVVITEETTGLPTCPLRVLEALLAVGIFHDQVLANPDTEILAP